MLRAVGFLFGVFFFAATRVSVTALNLCLKFVTIYYQHQVEGMSGNVFTDQVRMSEFLSCLLKVSQRKKTFVFVFCEVFS